MGGTYGRRVVVVAGKGNNGADGRYAADRLAPAGRPGDGGRRRRTARRAPRRARPGDRRRLRHRVPGRVPGARPPGRPRPGGRHPVGHRRAHRRGRAGRGAGRPHRHLRRPQARAAARRPGGGRAGRVDVVDIGLDVSGATIRLVEAADVDRWVPRRPVDCHKWKTAIWMVAGSPGMTGAAHLAARAAMRAGAGTVRLGIPGGHPAPPFLEIVGRPLPGEGWDADVLADLRRIEGPGRGPRPGTGRRHRRLRAPAGGGHGVRCPRSSTPTACTPWARPTRRPPSSGSAPRRPSSRPTTASSPGCRQPARPRPDRLSPATWPSRSGATVLLKGPTTVVADPSGQVLLSNDGDERLATAGTGDVLAGVIGAFLAQGLDGLRAAAGGRLRPRPGRAPRLAPRPGRRRPARPAAGRPWSPLTGPLLIGRRCCGAADFAADPEV